MFSTGYRPAKHLLRWLGFSARNSTLWRHGLMTPADDTDELKRRGAGPEAGLSFGLIHPRPPPFTGVREPPARAGQDAGGRW
jgi:hypothetical protein